MRVILFRGKRIDNGAWAFGDLRNYETVEVKAIFDHELLSRLKVIPETVGQFTGLYDKNGERIFEGDIMKFQINSKTALVGKIVFMRGAFQFETTEHERERFSFDDEEIVMLSDDCEVIGNIYDNP